MSLSISIPSFASGLHATAASSCVGEFSSDSRPDLCEFFGWPSRSSRAISDACRLGGTAIVGEGTKAAVRRASSSDSVSSTAFVISSTNSGTPSVRSIMSLRMFAGSGLLPMIWSIMTFDCAGRQSIEDDGCDVRLFDPGRRRIPAGRSRSAAPDGSQHCSPADRTVPSSWGPPNVHPRKPSAPERSSDRTSDLPDERVHRSLPPLPRREIEHGIAPIVRQRQHLGNER